jgi:acetyl coenzyme A synthetase (ADP forming)-like protein
VHKNLETLLSPKSIAVIGASSSTEKVGSILFNNIISSGFQGSLFPVNPNINDLNGHQVYPNVTSLPQIVDLTLIAVPANLVNPILKEIGEKGIKNVVIYSAGYKEIGEAGKILEDEMAQIAKNFDLNILGPNCLGYINNLSNLNLTFGQNVSSTANLRFISQSGALAASLFDYFNENKLGFNQFITLGNKTVLNENDLLNYFLEEDKKNPDKISPIGLYLESISDGKEFLKLTSEISKYTPIFIIKPGKTQASVRAMQSHTGAIAGEDHILAEALKEAGVVRCETMEDFFELSRALCWEKAPVGPKVAVISNAGGPAVISADEIITNGLEMAELDEETKKQLSDILPRYASVINPVDVLGDALADRVAKACEIVLEKNQAQSLVVILTPQVMTQIEKTAELIDELGKKYKIPIFCSFIGGKLIKEGEDKLNEGHIPFFSFPERAIKIISYMWKWKKWQTENQSATQVQIQNDLISGDNKQKIKEILNKDVESNHPTLDNFEANDLLSLAGIPTPPTQSVSNLEEARNFVSQNRYPVVLKLSSPGLLHKADIGAIIQDISTDSELEAALINLNNKTRELPSDFNEQIKIQIQKDIINGTEIITGIKKDPNFGPVMLFGAGGTLAELLEDRNLHMLPVDHETAKKIVEESRIYPLLKGYRGQAPLALDKVFDVLIRLAALSMESENIEEIEINPLIVTQNDVFAVDGKVVLSHTKAVPAPSAPKFKVGKAIEATNLAGNYHYFVFESEAPMNFTPGQYVSIKVATTRINSYSLATHDGENKFGLLIDTSPGGPGSKYFDNLKVGDNISFLGPFGNFVYKDDDSKHILFLATGSGLAPLRCMIDNLLNVQNSQIPITLYLGLRHNSDVFWEEYFKTLSDKYPNFHYNLVVSQPDENWQGKTGHITEHVANDFPDAGEISVYLCGNKMMIDEVTKILQEKGAKNDRIYKEKF